MYQCPVLGGLRRLDCWGSGAFGASRGGGSHGGIDLAVDPGGVIIAPTSGEVIREARPYANDSRYSGVLFRGSDGVEFKIFYLTGWCIACYQQGEQLGTAQDIRKKYPVITNHIHLEVFVGGSRVNPMDYFDHCT